MTTLSPAIDAAAGTEARPMTDAGLSRVAIALAVAAGAALRVLILLGPIGRPDADEVIAGLMARHLGSDGLPLFFWGQHYGGALEVLPVALSLRLFGSSVVALRVPSLILAAASSVLVWRVATRFLDRRGAQLAGLLSWVGAAPAVWLSGREMLFYTPTVLLGLLVALFAFRLREGGSSWYRVGAVVAVLVGLWLSPNILYFVAPTLAVPALASVRRTWPRQRTALVAVTVAALAGWFVLWQATDHISALGAAGKALDPGGYPGRLRWFFTDGLPGLLGLREMFTYRWIGGATAVVAYLLLLGIIGLGAWRSVKAGAWDGLGLVIFPFVFALVPKATDQPNMRYLFFAVPFVAMAVARVAAPPSLRRRPWVAYAAVVVALSMTLVSLQRVYVVSEVEQSTRVGNVGDTDGVIAFLDAHGVDTAYASYWVAFRLAFESGERIIAVQPWDEQRYQPYLDRVEADPSRFWIVEPGPSRDSLRAALDEIGVGYRETAVGARAEGSGDDDFVVIETDRVVSPDELHGAVRTTL